MTQADPGSQAREDNRKDLRGLLDDARGLMAEDDWKREGVEPFHEVQVGMAEAGDRRLDQDFARPWLVDAHIFDDERFVGFIQHGGLHGRTPSKLLVRS